MKITHHIPTEQFGFTEVELAEGENTSYEEAKELYGAYNANEGVSGEGLDTKEFNQALDLYLKENKGETAVYLRMNPQQQMVFQEIKKSLKRLAPEGELRQRI